MVSGRKAAGDLDAVGLHVGDGCANESGHFARMRSDDQIVILAAGQARRIVGEHGERIRIQDQRHRGAIEERANELGHLRRAAKARSAGHDVVRLFEQLLDGARRERSGGIIRQIDGHEHR